MQEGVHFFEVLILLMAAVCIVALFRVMRISPVLGYLAAGALIGPHGLEMFVNVESANVIAEFGIIFLLFTIGLELSFDRLLAMRKHVLGFGTLQVLVTSLLIIGVAWALGLTIEAAVIVGGGLALSSTAVVLQILAERGERSSQVGRLSLAALITQDIAVIPLLVLLPILVGTEHSIMRALGEAGVKAFVGLTAIFLLGRLLFRPVFRFIGSLDNTELFTATTLMVVLLTAWVSSLAGLSPALGAFIAGLLIAESEFKPQVEADILPFKGLCLGLFFMVVGMSLDLKLLQMHWLSIFGITLALLLGKATIIFMLCRLFGFRKGSAIHAGLLLAQGGEFAFVLFTLASKVQLMPDHVTQQLLVVITITMALTPLMADIGKRISQKASSYNIPDLRAAAAETLDISNHVIIIGFGRVGRTIARLLDAENIPYIAVDMNTQVVTRERAKGFPVYYGDANRLHVLRVLGLQRARAVVISHGNPRISANTVVSIRESSQVPIVARARNIEQVEKLEELGVNLAVAEMVESSLQLGGALMRELGIQDAEISRIIDIFRAGDYALTRRGEEAVPPPAMPEGDATA